MSVLPALGADLADASQQTNESDVNPNSGNNTGNWPTGSYADESGTGNQMNPGGMTQGKSGGRGGLFPSGSGEGDEAQPKEGRGDKQVQSDKTV